MLLAEGNLMNTIKRRAIKLITLLSLSSLLLGYLPMVGAADNGVRVSIGKPSIWTLAQAHYLLAQMHQQDRGWKLANLTDLDPLPWAGRNTFVP